MYIKRNIEKTVVELSKSYPVIMVCGQRQVGKSTMLNHIKGDRKYVTLDDRTAYRLAKDDPELFFETYGYPLIIDEFQKAPSILNEIKHIVDMKLLNNEDCNGLFWLTGSQKFKMMNDISESLAGRVAVMDMSSLSFSEIEELDKGVFNPRIEELKKREFKPRNINEVYEDIFRGGMPKIIASNVDRDRYYMDYVNTYLERDVKDLSQVGKLDEFYQFLVYCAAHTAQEIKYDSISKEVGVSAPTIKQWITILERSGVIYILHPYYKKVTDRLVKTPKMYFLDTGLAAYLTKWPNAATLEMGNSSGAFFETYAVSEILKSYYNAGREPNLYYYRDIDKKEIDLLIVEGNSIFPIEIKKSKSPSDPDKNVSVLAKYDMDIEKMVVLCMVDDIVPLNKDTYLCPLNKI